MKFVMGASLCPRSPGVQHIPDRATSSPPAVDAYRRARGRRYALALRCARKTMKSSSVIGAVILRQARAHRRSVNLSPATSPLLNGEDLVHQVYPTCDLAGSLHWLMRMRVGRRGRHTLLRVSPCRSMAQGSRLRWIVAERARGSVSSRCSQRPACLPPGGRARWAPSGGMDTTRAAAQFRLAAVERGNPIEDIAHLVGHANTRTTEKVYRKELRPVLRRGAKAMDDLFKAHQEASEPPNLPPASNENQTER